MENIKLIFHGYQVNLEGIIAKHGIYIAHAIKWADDDHSHLYTIQLLYIGKAEGTNNLTKRVQEHIDRTDPKQNHLIWGHKLSAKGRDYDEILYSYAECDEKNLADIETALIYANENNGIFNDKDTHGHNNQDANKLNVLCTGKKGMLKDHIIENK